MLAQLLSPVEVRVLASLIEKELSTPEHYPLSLNALTSACNQSSNRDPVMTLDEGTVSGTIDSLRRMNLVRSMQASGSRVPKYHHLLGEAGELSRTELSIMCVLMLRGPQTLGEVRSRTGRFLTGNGKESIDAALESLLAREPANTVARLPRKPGQKEVRVAHLLGGEVSYETQDTQASAPAAASDRIAALEERTQELGSEVADLRAQLAAFRKQFE